MRPTVHGRRENNAQQWRRMVTSFPRRDAISRATAAAAVARANLIRVCLWWRWFLLSIESQDSGLSRGGVPPQGKAAGVRSGEAQTGRQPIYIRSFLSVWESNERTWNISREVDRRGGELEDHERLAVIAGEIDGGVFDWRRMRWEESR
jgi:hypothetical protein